MQCKVILIIEDDEGIRETLKVVLEMEGYEVYTAENGRQGLDALSKITQPCLILLDLMMPIMSGFEFLSIQKNDIVIAPIPVVIISAFPDEMKKVNAAGFVKKPIDLDVLLKWTQQYCG